LGDPHHRSTPFPRHTEQATTRINGLRVVDERTTTSRRGRTIFQPRPRQARQCCGAEAVTELLLGGLW